MITLNEKYYDKVMDGEKVQTIRKGRKDISLGKNYLDFVWGEGSNTQVHTAKEIIVQSVTYKWYGRITQEEAKLDGFESKAELGDELELYYPRQISETSEMTLIKFILVDED